MSSSEEQRWRLWRRRWESDRNAWGEWQPTETVFGDSEYSDFEQQVSDDQLELEIRPEPAEPSK